MSPEGPMSASVGVQVSWYCWGVQRASLTMATLPMSGAAPLPSATPSSANQSAKAAPPRSSTSLAKRASRSKRIILPGLMVVSDSGLGALAAAPGSGSCARRAGTMLPKAIRIPVNEAIGIAPTLLLTFEDLCTFVHPHCPIYRNPTTPALVRIRSGSGPDQVRIRRSGSGRPGQVVRVRRIGSGGAGREEGRSGKQLNYSWRDNSFRPDQTRRHQIRQNNRGVLRGLVGILEDGLSPGEIHWSRDGTARANQSKALRR